MDAFEQLAAELLFAEGWWVQNSVKVHLTKEEKKRVGRASTPRWELDIVAYKGSTNEILVVECKSFLDSRGVQFCELQDGHSSKRYKLFREPLLREVVFDRLVTQMVGEGRCAPKPSIRLGMMAGKIKAGDDQNLVDHFAAEGWSFFGPEWLRDRLHRVSTHSYSNQVAAIVAKLLLREPKDEAFSPKSGQKSRTAKKAAKSQASLELLVTANPKKPGSQAHARCANYFSSAVKTVGDALKAGLRMDDIRNDVAKGYIRVGDN